MYQLEWKQPTRLLESCTIVTIIATRQALPFGRCIMNYNYSTFSCFLRCKINDYWIGLNWIESITSVILLSENWYLTSNIRECIQYIHISVLLYYCFSYLMIFFRRHNMKSLLQNSLLGYCHMFPSAALLQYPQTHPWLPAVDRTRVQCLTQREHIYTTNDLISIWYEWDSVHLWGKYTRMLMMRASHPGKKTGSL